MKATKLHVFLQLFVSHLIFWRFLQFRPVSEDLKKNILELLVRDFVKLLQTVLKRECNKFPACDTLNLRSDCDCVLLNSRLTYKN